MNPFTVVVAGTPVRVGEHALWRYQERVRPTLGVAQTRAELRLVLPLAERRASGPGWVNDPLRADEWVVMTDSIAFPVVRGELVTCLTRAAQGEEVRARRSQQRRERSAERKVRRDRPADKRGALARDDRRRRWVSRDGVDG